MAGYLGLRDGGIKHLSHEVDVCVVGGGPAGLCAAVAAARHGARVLLMQERPMLGGNASSEIRMHICGADRHGTLPNLRETGILEELRLENARHNPHQSWSMWDTVVYEKARFQPGLELLLNCSCLAAEMDGRTIVGVSGWQLTTETYHDVRAKIFIDCTGDGLLAPLSGAEFRMGREGRAEYNESIAPEVADDDTMGLTCLFEAHRHETPQPYQPPAWAYAFPTDDDLPYGARGHDWWRYGYWWVELGGDRNSLYEAEDMRDELLKIVFGVWDHIKNRGDHGADNWALDWVGFLPGKRESRRYVGAHVLSQRDIEAGGPFPDAVAYGGWTMDDHHPAGFGAARLGRPATIFHAAPSPYGIPLRSLYTRDVNNLFFAGRCASCTHTAMSSTRVMGTAGVMGQAAGTAAALAVRDDLTPDQVDERCISELQQMLLHDDCYIPGIRQEFGAATRSASLLASRGDPEPLRDGVSRPVGSADHAWSCAPGDWVSLQLAAVEMISKVTLVFESGLDKLLIQDHDEPRHNQIYTVPEVMVKAFHLDTMTDDGEWTRIYETGDNYQRCVRVPVHRRVGEVRVTVDATWGSTSTRMYAFYVD